LQNINKLLSQTNSENQDMKLKIINFQRQIDFKDQEMKKQASEIKNYQTDIERLKKKHYTELENMEADTKAKYEELKSMYKSATFKSAMNTSIDRLES